MKALSKAFLFIESLGAYDGYVPFRYVRKYLSFLTKIRFVQKIRITLWSRIASEYEPFRPFYCAVARNEILAELKNEHVKEYYAKGTTVVEDALSTNSNEQLRSIVDELDLSVDVKNNFHQMSLKECAPEVCAEILQSLSPFYQTLFPEVDVPQRFTKSGVVDLRVDFSNDGVDQAVSTANWHPDRFVPTLNAIWYPFGSNWGEFEKDIGDPIITDNDINSFVSFKKLNGGDERQRDNQYFNLGRQPKKFTVPPNTLVVGTHHIQHRRSPFYSPGKRIAVFIDHYDIFTMKDLMKC